MKYMILLTFLISSGSVMAQPSSLEFLQNFLKENAPCTPGLYCYDYELNTDAEHLIFTFKLYNYDEKGKKFTESSVYTIPVNRIKDVKYYPYQQAIIWIETQGDDVKKTTGEKVEYFNMCAIDFKKEILQSNIKADLRANLNDLISSFE